MRQRLGILITIVVAVGVLILINSLAYVSEEEKQDSELSPDRSTYNAGSTGTRALHDLLNESGYQVMRWREPIERLLGGSGQKVQTFVLVGRPRISFDHEEAKSLLLWVARGGRLVIVDRRPEEFLLPRSGEWKVTTEFLNFPVDTDPSHPEQMTEGVKPVVPAQLTLLTRDVAAVMPSRFFSAIKLFAINKESNADTGKERTGAVDEGLPGDFDEDSESDAGGSPDTVPENPAQGISPAPVVHLATTKAPLLIDYQHGKGRIILLTDPFMLANAGISLKDNLQLAINLLSPASGLIAFDEFHQGHGATRNAFVGYFQGTPVLAICGQILLVILAVLWTRGRRFARPLPLAQVDRRSSLEFVASMAELQQRARAFDLAIENIYSRTRRVLARYAGVDYNSPRKVIAERIAARSTLNAHQLETLMRQSEEAINGGGISERQSIHLVRRLREIEAALGLRMRSREVKQSAQNI
ncbi:MAG TPA: DUF4350 domain-containing protein, partial [Pyrinomonadaceae bacterium]|jgi:hypothetical protein|nr:DUF4350 domain-containing protein [Pyrinomonadaceae bacterium]